MAVCATEVGQMGAYMIIKDKVDVIKGVGEKTAKNFAKLGIVTVMDLLEHYPRGYEVYEVPRSIESILEGEIVSIQASVYTMAEIKRIKSMQILSCHVKDPTGTIKLTWFNEPYLKNTLRGGYRFIFRGKAVRKNGIIVLEQPKIFMQDEYRKYIGVLQPVYPLTAGLTNNAIQKSVRAALLVVDFNTDYLPRRIRKEYGLIQRKYAIQEIHFPKSAETMAEARKRLVFDEFFLFVAAVSQIKEQKAILENDFFMTDKVECDEFIHSLRYNLTKAQQNVWREMRADMTGTGIMNRLIQGDVGSGKTILAILSLMLTALNGYQGCLMVPTEVLAIQHYEELVKLVAGYGIRTELLTGSMTAAEKRKAYERIKQHEADIIVGTHALIQEKVVYADLALVITDEQHRFGVRQREMLSEKGKNPHVLVMSATPIPRTLAIILYGDLDISILDELPANRLPIKTCVVDTGYRPTAYRFIEKQVQLGRQVYLICPMVEESEAIEAENVIEYSERLREILSGDIKIEYLHGKMKTVEKNKIMEQFVGGDISILVSTTVVEVGVNVPNATVIMIENAERFGLAQLHQLRGRVGRGAYQSYCILVSGSSGKETMERLEILNKSGDGFYIAGEDLKLRGPGDFFGIRQSGDLEFKLGDIYNDSNVLKSASDGAKSLTEEEYVKMYEAYPEFYEKISRFSFKSL